MKKFPLLVTLIVVFITFGQATFGQEKIITFSNSLNAYYSKGESSDTFIRFREPKINEIILNPDKSFEFWSRPNMSCFTWRNYKGIWKRDNDTLMFNDSYQIEENDTKATYKRDSRQEFIIIFRTDKNSVLKNKTMKVQYVYDYWAHLDGLEKIFYLDTNNSVVIPYAEIPDIEKLAAIRIEYLLNCTDKRYDYLTENKTINIKHGDISNIINVEFIEKPQKEIVYRTIRAIVKNDTLRIVSSFKTKTILEDYSHDIQFEESYTLNR